FDCHPKCASAFPNTYEDPNRAEKLRHNEIDCLEMGVMPSRR
ncbi:hypothetical protein LCGC14_1966640, partial [marine sediment metagenome]